MERVVDAREQELAPPLEILLKTFGIIRQRRTLTVADSVAYVYERTKNIFGQEVCKAYRITEHPITSSPQYSTHTGPSSGHADMPGPRPDAKPDIETVDVSCNDKNMEKYVPGSITSPVPRHP